MYNVIPKYIFLISLGRNVKCVLSERTHGSLQEWSAREMLILVDEFEFLRILDWVSMHQQLYRQWPSPCIT